MGKKILYQIRTYIFDIITAIITFIIAFLAYTLNRDPRTAFIFSGVVVFLGLLFIIYVRARDKDFYFLPLQNWKDKEDWIGNGHFEYSRTQNAFEITNAEPGYIFSKCLNWSDYRFTFDFKLRKQCLGAVVRAVNLSNYVMLQITSDGIRPHLRINGGWNAWEANDAGLRFPQSLELKNWYRCTLTCDKNVINIKISSKKDVILDREWIIPSGGIVFSFKTDEQDSRPVNIPFPINVEYGSIGFRNSGDEKAVIKDLLIEKL